jgi:choline dehydrogenase-like flavoprotein
VMWTSYHPLGTCKMGLDPRTSVVGLDHEAHDVPGLFIVDGSTVPGPLGVNPQITIMAMATRAAVRIAARMNVTSSAA